ncbi:hypothetical protein GBF38_020884 [Nibea albiflora]|uniref:Uncharacterized protein n=1 Tax=Nibea albiflora TaxID=240163 RepID=A0ACB7FIK5_NIBAL|nr:hypothetical protein GBF38_020884 [Nibea albiflora]
MGSSNVVLEQELGKQAMKPGSAASTDMMTESKKLKSTLMEEAKKRKGEMYDMSRNDQFIQDYNVKEARFGISPAQLCRSAFPVQR